MTTIDSYLFLALGMVMQVVPAIAPGYFPPTGITGTNSSELWLELMGWVNYVIGAGFIAHLQVRPLLKQLVSWSEASWQELTPIELFRPAVRFELQLQLHDETGQHAFL